MFIGFCIVAFSYFLGSISTSILIAKMFGVKDIRKHGSGNAGSTNVLRTVGKKAAALTFLGDFLKGVIPVIVSYFVCQEYKVQFALLSAMMAVIGHIFPAYFSFKGGKGVATSFGAVIALSALTGKIWIPLALFGIWLLVVIITRYVSLGSVIVFAVYPILVAVFCIKMPLEDYISYIIFGVAVGTLGIVMHRKNIKRLIKGTESKIGQKAK